MYSEHSIKDKRRFIISNVSGQDLKLNDHKGKKTLLEAAIELGYIPINNLTKR